MGNVRGLTDGLYDRSGARLSRDSYVIKDNVTDCVLSRKLEDDNGNRREYDNAWEALHEYIGIVYQAFLGNSGAKAEADERPYTFDVLGDQDPIAREWRHLVAQECVTIIGLGGVGAWIADLVVKADAKEVHGWDHDKIEPKNILRMPGSLDPCTWINKRKAVWFQRTYSHP